MIENLNLIPFRYRKFAWISLILFFFSAVLIKISGENLNPNSKEIFQNIVQSGVLLSLLSLTLSASKREDEMSIQIRIKAFTNAFIFGVGYTAVIPFASLIVDGEISIPSLFELLLMMFAVFFISFYSITKKAE